MNYSRASNILDKKRIGYGGENLQSFFESLCSQDIKMAISLLNDNILSFTSLFILQNSIKKFSLNAMLNLRNQLALEVIYEVLSDVKSHEDENLLNIYIQKVNSVLIWILDTGSLDDGLSNEFDQVLDVCAILLLKVYKEKSKLPLISELIFARHRKFHFIHDLVWAFLEARDPGSLMLIASRLRSIHEADISLARKLLSFVPNINKQNDDTEKQYMTFLKWLEENNLFLLYKGESFQQTNRPKPYEIVYEGKYICKNVSIDSGEIISDLLQDELSLINEFKVLDLNTKIFLSNFSFNLHRKDLEAWNQWLHSPIDVQINISIAGGIQ